MSPTPKPRRGRPPGDPALVRSGQIPVRVSAAEAARYEAAAKAEGTSLAEVARAAWDRLARRAAK